MGGEDQLRKEYSFWLIFATSNFLVKSSLDRSRSRVFQFPRVLKIGLSESPR